MPAKPVYPQLKNPRKRENLGLADRIDLQIAELDDDKFIRS